MSPKSKLKFTKLLKSDHYYEYRLAELVRYLMDSRRTPMDVKNDIRLFYNHFLKFMQFDMDPYGMKWVFENEKIIFTREKTGEQWAVIEP